MSNQDKTKYNSYIESLKTDMIVPIEYITANSLLDLNIDANKLIFAVVESQSLYLEPLIGAALLRKLQGNMLPFAYQLLLDRFLNRALVSWGVAEALQGVYYSVKNGGIYHHAPTDAEIATPTEVNTLRQTYLNKADQFAGRLVDFLCKNSSHYPEYNQAVADGLIAQKQALYTGGLLIEQLHCNTMERVGPADPNIFTAETWWGNNAIQMPGFDPNTLSDSSNTLPSDIFAQPNDDYFWIVSDTDFAIGQFGTLIPLDSFLDTNVLESTYVKGTMNGLFWIRIKMIDTYEVPVQFTIASL